jgi:hypothetical protein
MRYAFFVSRLVSAIALMTVSGFALADGSSVVVAVGTQTERVVGNAHGWFCDDSTLVDAKIETRGELNYWVVTGVKLGTTQCRVGTDTSRASFVFDVTVIAKPAKKPAR